MLALLLIIAFVVMLIVLLIFLALKGSSERNEPQSSHIETVPPSMERDWDKSVYSDAPKATQEDDMEEDLALLDDDDDLW